MLAGMCLLSMLVASHFLMASLLTVNVNVPAYNPQDLQQPAVSSGVTTPVMLTGSNQVVKDIANKSLSIVNEAASNNVTMPAVSADSRLYNMSGTMHFAPTPFDVNHTIENTNAREYPLSTSSWVVPVAGQETTALQTGTTVGGSSYANLAPENLAWQVASAGNTVNVTLFFTSTRSALNVQTIDVFFKLNFNQSVNYSVYFLDRRHGTGWVKQNEDPVFVGSNLLVTHQYRFVNTNSRFVGSITTQFNVSLVIQANSSFRADLYEFKTRESSTQRENTIRSSEWVALSFDLRGPATVQGFWMWVRARDLNTAGNLLMRVYDANSTSITLNQVRLQSNVLLMRPDLTKPRTAIQTFANYSGDSYAYFPLPAPTVLPAGNYFVVLNSSVTGTRYTIPYLPYTVDPDAQRNDHLFAFSTSSGATWTLRTETIASVARVVDAAPFAVQLRRGMIPSDVALKLANETVADFQASYTTPFSTTNYEWGKGSFNRGNLTVDASAGTFTLPATWNATILPAFLYNATFLAWAYARVNVAPAVRVTSTEILWTYPHAFNRTAYPSWVGSSFNFTCPADWVVRNVTYPNGINYYHAANAKIVAGVQEYAVNASSILNIGVASRDGTYTMKATSPNYVKAVDTYLHHGGSFFACTHFMPGDDMTVRTRVQTGGGRAVFNGVVNLTMFNIAGGVLSSTTSGVINNTLNFTTSYHFQDQTILSFTGGTPAGKYVTRGLWFNGSQVGIVYQDVFRVAYNIQEINAEELVDNGLDRVFGSFTTSVNESIPTDIFYVSFENGTKRATGAPVQELVDNIWLENFTQSETILNPGETIQFMLNMSNHDPIFRKDVRVEIELVQYGLPDRVITRVETPVDVRLEPRGDAGDTILLNMSAVFPVAGAPGFNAPVRNGMFQTIVHVHVNGLLQTSWSSNKTLSMRVENNATDGTILAVKANYNRTGRIFSQTFNRTTETLFNMPTHFAVILQSVHGVTLPSMNVITLTNQMQSRFANVTFIPREGDILARNNQVVIDGVLLFENGTVMTGTRQVRVWRESGGAWLPFTLSTGGGNTISAVNGSFSGVFTIPSTASTGVGVMLNWTGVGGLVAGSRIEQAMNLTSYSSTCEISFSNRLVILGDHKNFFTVRVENTGNSTLVFDARPTFSNVSSRFTTWLNVDRLNVKPGESFTFGVVLLHAEPGLGKEIAKIMSVSFAARAIETKENVVISQEFDVTIASVDMMTRLAAVWQVFFFALVGVLAFLVILFARNVAADAKAPVKAGALARAKVDKTGAKPFQVKKGSQLATPGDEKAPKYRSIDDVMDEIKGDAKSKDDLPGGDGDPGT